MDSNNAQCDRTIRLRDGRTLSYAEYGDPQSAPVVLCHGTPGSRLLNPHSILPAAPGQRFIVPDRPGYGRSSFTTDWGLLDWPADLAQLLTALAVRRFAVMGISGGGPYAAAAARSMSDRVSSLMLICSVGPLPPDRAAATAPAAGAYSPDEETQAARSSSWPHFREWFLSYYGTAPLDATAIPPTLPPADREVRARPEVQLYLRQLWRGAFAQGMAAWAYDSWLLCRPWGFNVTDIVTPTYVWHGEEDQNVPVERGQYLAATIPDCRATFYPGEGHLFFHNHWAEIFAAMRD